MNFKSGILKLSIILMLVLVLIPVASAMDSDEGFYQEYDTEPVECQNYEGVVEEYNDWQVVDTQEEVSYQDDYGGSDNIIEDESNIDQPQPISNDEDAVIVSEFEVNSVDETHNIIVNEDASVQAEYEIHAQSVSDAIDHNVNEDSVDDLTFKSIVNQGSIFISKYNNSMVNYVVITHILCAEVLDTDLTSFNRNIDKVLELKNNLLLRQDMQTACSGYKVNDLEDIIVCMNHINTDFAYSIDNSIVGNHAEIFLINHSCFYNLSPCFAATFCDFIFVEYFSGCDLMIASGFADFVVEFCQGNFVVENSRESLCLIDFHV